MARVFNTTGPCLPEDHYMLPPERRAGQVRSLIDGKGFFVLHSPRQTGKTTLLRSLSRALTTEGRYAALTVSVESFTGADVASMIPQMLRAIEEAARFQLPEVCAPPDRRAFLNDSHIALRSYLTQWACSISRPLVVFFDEIDALSGEVLISVLSQLRDGYTSRPAPFPHSVALVGLTDVREYRSGEGSNLGSSSPFNIKVRSLSLRRFTEAEVFELLNQHTEETGQEFETEAAAEIFSQTRGQPWLVNALAGQLVTDFDSLVNDRTVRISRRMVLDAREILIQRRDTHLDSLVRRLREDRVRRIVEPILTGAIASEPTYDDDFSYVRDLGLVTVEDGALEIANPIYREIVPRVLTQQTQTSIADDPAWFVASDGTLDIPKLINGFLEFWRRHGEVLLRGTTYQEAAPHLVFMAYLQRIVNAGGRIEREYAAGTGRVDLAIEHGGRTDIIELKIERGSHTLSDGLAQTSRYASRLGRDIGYLIIFDPRRSRRWNELGVVEEMTLDGVRVIVVRA